MVTRRWRCALTVGAGACALRARAEAAASGSAKRQAPGGRAGEAGLGAKRGLARATVPRLLGGAGGFRMVRTSCRLGNAQTLGPARRLPGVRASRSRGGAAGTVSAGRRWCWRWPWRTALSGGRRLPLGSLPATDGVVRGRQRQGRQLRGHGRPQDTRSCLPVREDPGLRVRCAGRGGEDLEAPRQPTVFQPTGKWEKLT